MYTVSASGNGYTYPDADIFPETVNDILLTPPIVFDIADKLIPTVLGCTFTYNTGELAMYRFNIAPPPILSMFTAFTSLSLLITNPLVVFNVVSIENFPPNALKLPLI